ncbi:MAG: hypothetical protein AUK47_19740 [Deltaproteobacteria bacterium CG2_30_63_29]|nr:MAG: hypothetical protein AUK47_19740 [Deltaproteobacteria bacterium CG2_30_63_29]
MTSRRFFIYFVVATVFTITATVIFEVYSFRHVIDHSMEQEMLFARSISRFVSGAIKQEGAQLKFVLEHTDGVDDEKALRKEADLLPTQLIERQGVVFFNTRFDVIATASKAKLPPPHVLIAALRGIVGSEDMTVTDYWQSSDGTPYVSLFYGHGEGKAWRATMGNIRLDSEGFIRLFNYFIVSEEARLQLLDSSGVALFSTFERERYRSVVHGTYLTDKVRLGEPLQMPCHSCHDPENAEPTREDEITTVAPIPGTTWAVSVRESSAHIYNPLTDLIYSSVALVCIIFGTFAGFFLVMARQVLRPMRQLALAATSISRGHIDSPIMLGADDEIGVLARSFEAMRKMLEPSPQDEQLPAKAPTSEDEVENGEQDDPQPTVSMGMPWTSSSGASPYANILEQTVKTVIDELVGVELVRSAILFLEFEDDGTLALVTHGIELKASPRVSQRLYQASATGSIVSIEALKDYDILAGPVQDTQAFYVQEINPLDKYRGQLWLGVSSRSEEMLRTMRFALSLISTQVESLLERNLLYARLHNEHEQKNKMVRHLFEAEASERKWIAQEIHDETAQLLTTLLLMFETFPSAEQPEDQDKALDRARDRVTQILDGIHRLLRRLRPAVLDDLGLNEAIKSVGRNVLQDQGVEFEMKFVGSDVFLAKDVENTVYRVFQEAVTNTVRHAGASRVRAEFEVGEEFLSAVIEDNGKGMDLKWMRDPDERPRWGVLGMRERIHQLGGVIDFSTPEGGGTRISLKVPLPDEEEED